MQLRILVRGWWTGDVNGIVNGYVRGAVTVAVAVADPGHCFSSP